MAQGTIAPFPKHQFFTNAGAVAAGYQFFSWAAGTSNKMSTYSDADLTVANANPILLDASGRATIFLSPSTYKFSLALPGDVDPPLSPIWTVDGVQAVPSTQVATDVQGFAGETLVATDCVYQSDGSGGTTLGRWYKTDADLYYASAGAKATGFVVAGIATGAVGSIRIGGIASGFSSLTVGVNYYASSTAGAITSTVPAQGTGYRLVGSANSITTILLAEKAKAQTRERVAAMVATVGNVGTGEDTLFSYVALAGELGVDSMRYCGKFWGNTANNAAVKTIRLRLIEGANNTVIITKTANASIAGFWELEFEILRTGAAASRYTATAQDGVANGTATVSGNSGILAVTTWANSIEIRLTADTTTSNDVTAIAGFIELKD